MGIDRVVDNEVLMSFDEVNSLLGVYGINERKIDNIGGKREVYIPSNNDFCRMGKDLGVEAYTGKNSSEIPPSMRWTAYFDYRGWRFIGSTLADK